MSIPFENLTNNATATVHWTPKIDPYLQEPFASSCIRRTLLALTFLFAIFGNLVVVRATCGIQGRKPFAYVLVTNLALGELGQCFIYPFLFFYIEAYQWSFGEFLCKLMNPLANACGVNVTLTMATIAVYRWWNIEKSRSVAKISPMRVKIVIFSFWFVGMILSLPEASTRVVQPCPGRPERNCCREVWSSPATGRAYHYAFRVLTSYIPITVIMISYSLVGYKLHQHIMVIRRATRYNGQSGATSDTICNDMNHQEFHLTPVSPVPQNIMAEEKENERTIDAYRRGNSSVVELEKNLLKMFYIIVFSFLLCYIPVQVMFFLHANGILQKWKYGLIVALYLMWLSLVPSALHPFIYGTKSKFYAKAFSGLLTCKKQCARLNTENVEDN